MKKIIKFIIPLAAAAAFTACTQQTNQEKYIGQQAAKAYALEEAGISESDASFEKTELESKNGMSYYEIDFVSGNQKYEYDVDAITGVIIESKTKLIDAALQAEAANSQSVTAPEQNAVSQAQSSTQGEITEDEAKNIALSHAGVDSQSATFVKVGYDWEDGRKVYEIEFYSPDREEYDYEIDVSTGEILSFDYDAEHYNPGADISSQITAEEAKNIALSQVPGATADDIYEFETDIDDGRLEYEGEIYYSNMKYEFSIDGYSGAIRSWESENVHR